MLSGPASSPATDRLDVESPGSTVPRTDDDESSDLSRRLETERLRYQLAVLRGESEALRNRVGELEATVVLKEDQLENAKATIDQQDQQLNAVIDRYETIVAEKDRIAEERAGGGFRATIDAVVARFSTSGKRVFSRFLRI